MQDVLDYKAQHWLKTFIASMTDFERRQLKNLAHCGETTENQDMPVFLLTQGKHSKFVGQRTCKNSFACPICSARVMGRHRTNIACAIEALKAKGFMAVMVTFALPHLQFMTCKETVDILYNTWISAFQNRNARRKCKDGSFRASNPCNQWYYQADIKYSVRASEYTWGENGWNPHFHVLFWFPRKNFDVFQSFQATIEQYWVKTAEKETAKYWAAKNLHGDDTNRAKLLDRVFWARNAGYTVKFSDHEAQSSDYVAGWGEDREMTGNVRKQASHDGHFTPYQILDFAVQEKNFSSQWAMLYKEFMLNVTRKPVHRRVEYSKGLHAVITQYKSCTEYREILAKKNASQDKWEVVCWFTPADWLRLCRISVCDDVAIIPLLLATVNVGWSISHVQTCMLIERICADYGIRVNFCPHPIYSKAITDAFNHAA